MSDTPRTDAVYAANIGHPLRMARMLDHARKLEGELNQSKLDRLAAQVEADTWGNCAELLAKHAPGVSDQDCKALVVFEKLIGVKP